MTESLPHNSLLHEPRNPRSHARPEAMDRGMRPFERVYTMTDYYDGPRQGIASFDSRPHLYDSPFNHWEEQYEDLYELRPVDELTFQLALEDWEIWLRWEAAFHAGTATVDTHPALPAERARHDELARRLAGRLVELPGPAIRARAVFRRGGDGDATWLEVQWTPVDRAGGTEPP